MEEKILGAVEKSKKICKLPEEYGYSSVVAEVWEDYFNDSSSIEELDKILDGLIETMKE